MDAVGVGEVAELGLQVRSNSGSNSSSGRSKFSVEKAYSVSSATPKSAHQSRTRSVAARRPGGRRRVVAALPGVPPISVLDDRDVCRYVLDLSMEVPAVRALGKHAETIQHTCGPTRPRGMYFML